jgi:hypothetical protein
MAAIKQMIQTNEAIMSKFSFCILILIISISCFAFGFETPLTPSCTVKSKIEGSPIADDPATFAWRLFACLNKLEKGEPQKPLLYWETWASPNDLYCDESRKNCSPDVKPTWPATANSYRERIREQVLALAEQPTPHVPIGEGQEVRLNNTVFDYVTKNDLWYLQGQQRVFRDPKGKVNFPLGAMEIKAYWIEVLESQKDRYFWRKEDNGLFFGLIALNIAAKTQSQWFWTTFEHVDNPMRCAFIPCSNRVFSTISGANRTIQSPLDPKLLKILMEEGIDPAKQQGWANYRLHDAQINFLDPILLGNSVLEADFEGSSSCITCHSRASINFKGQPLSIRDQNSKSTFIGQPDRSWFCDENDNRVFLSFDYVWSLTRAQRVPKLPDPVLGSAPKCGNFDWLPNKEIPH